MPYGLRVAEDGVHLGEDEAEQAVLRVVRELRASGLTLRAIVAELAACSLGSRTRRPFALTQVANMLAAEDGVGAACDALEELHAGSRKR